MDGCCGVNVAWRFSFCDAGVLCYDASVFKKGASELSIVLGKRCKSNGKKPNRAEAGGWVAWA